MNILRRVTIGCGRIRRSLLAGRRSSFSVPLLLASLVLLVGAVPTARAQAEATGEISGRVQNASTGTYLNNARIRVVGTNRESFTNQAGEYRLTGVPAGPALVTVFYTGLERQEVSVLVPPGGLAQQNFDLAPLNALREDGAVIMSEFVVQSQRETNAAALAVNEQRFAANRRDVVSTDAFGEINQGNIGEFVKFLPGISLDVKDGNTPSGIMVRGFDPNYTNVTMDGGRMASTIIANTQTSSRQFVLDGANINDIARIEVVKLPTPDMSANLLGGAVNFVSRSAFERARPELRISSYLSANAKAMDFFKKTPGPLKESTYKVLPSFDLQYANPVSKDFGYVVTAAHSSQYYLQNRTVFGARFTSQGATIDNPYTTNANTNFAQNRSDRTSGALTFDYRPFERNVLNLKILANASKQQTASRSLNYNVGGGQPVRWDENNVFGSLTTNGSVGMGNSFQERHSLTRGVSGSWKFDGNDWEAELAGSYSNSNNRTRDTAKGFFRGVNVNLPNVRTVNLENIDHANARFGNASVFNAAGQRIDELRLANYNLTQGTSEPLNAEDNLKEVRLNITRHFEILGMPVSIKFGGSVEDTTRDLDYQPAVWTYLGPDGRAASGDEGMANYVSELDRGVSPGFGRPAPEWPDSFKIFDSMRNNVTWWAQTPSQAGDSVRNRAIRSPWLHETITAGYVMSDLKLLANRLRLVGGVRYELTETEGRGFKQSPDDVYVKDAQGRPIRVNNAFVVRPELLPVGSAAYNSVLYTLRGYHNAKDYDYFHPSIHGTYNITENLLIRAAFAKTIGRPNLSDIVPNLFVGENINFGVPGQSSSNVPGFITGANTGLRPWSAKNYDYSIEYYLPRNGQLMFNYYKKDIRDFHSNLTRIADAALLDELGLDDTALGYQYTQRINAGDARIEGWEASAVLPLANFMDYPPVSWMGQYARYFSLRANYTHLELSGSRITSSDWKRYIPRSRNFGVHFYSPKWSGNVLVNWRGKMLRDTANQFPGANEYIRARYQVDGDLSYQFTPRFSVFVAVRNMFNTPSQWEVSGPGVPAWSTLTNYEDYGAQYSLGVRGTF